MSSNAVNGFNLLNSRKSKGTIVDVDIPETVNGFDLLKGKKQTRRVFESKVPKGKKLKTKDLYSASNLNIIREYMYRKKGEPYREQDKDDDKLVNDFVDQMRWFNSNTLSTAGEVQFINKGTEADKAAAGAAYDLYDQLGNIFTRGESLSGKVDGIKDYLFAAASDPSNYIGLLTGGLAKGATLGVTQGAKEAIKAASRQAYKKAAKEGLSSQATQKLADEAGESVIKNMTKRQANTKAGKRARDMAARNIKYEQSRLAGSKAVKDFESKRKTKGFVAELAGTASVDALIAGFQDIAIQDIYLDANVDDSIDSINYNQSLLNGLLGGVVAPAFSMAPKGARKIFGKSDLGKAKEELAVKQFTTKGQVDADIQFKVATVLKNSYKTWQQKVEAGKKATKDRPLPEGLLSEILLGPDGDGEKGVVGLLRQQGITVNKDTFISDFLTDVIRVMPDEDFFDISKTFEGKTSIPLGEVAAAKIKLSDVIASYASQLGSELSVLAQAKNKLNAGVVIGNDLMEKALDRKEVRDSLEDGLGSYFKSKSFREGAEVILRSNKNKKGKILGIKDGVATVVFEDAKKKGKKVKPPEIKVGSNVIPPDRDNVGKVISLSKGSIKDPTTATIEFVNPDTKAKITKDFPLRDLTTAAKGPDDAAAREYKLEQLDLVEDQMGGKPKSSLYVQNVWRRALVSSVPTTAANIFGWSQYYLGQTVADALSGAQYYAYGVMSGDKEAMRVGKVYFQVQGAKFRNFLDPFTTHDAYMKYLDESKNTRDLLHETVGGTGVESSAKRFGFDKDNKPYQIIEKYVDAASRITGVRAQDTFTKSQTFMTELDKQLRIKKGVTLSEAMRGNSLNIIDEDVAGLAVDSTLRSVFSKDYTTDDQMLKKAARLVEDVSNIPVLGSIMPFGRFFNNVIATVYQLGPWGLIAPASRIVKTATGKQGRDVRDVEAISRAAVGTAGLIMAARMDQDRQEAGLESTQFDVGGTKIDAKNAFPMSEFMAMGRVFNQLAQMGGTSKLSKASGAMTQIEPADTDIKTIVPYKPIVAKESVEDMMAQLGVGQFAKDIQFGNDMYRVLDMMFSDANGGAAASEIQKRAGSFIAGFTRPLQTIDKAVGFILDTDIHKDRRSVSYVDQETGEVKLRAKTGGEVFKGEATRYLDNILQAIGASTEASDFNQLRVASREGALYDPNPLATVFGIKVLADKTATEQLYTLSNLKTFRADSRSKVPMYDRLFNELLSPLLERKARALLSDSKFIKGSNTYKRVKAKQILTEVRKTVKAGMSTLSEEHRINQRRYDTINKAHDSEEYKNAVAGMHKIRLDRMRDRGATEESLKQIEVKDPLDYNHTELNMFEYMLDAYKGYRKGDI